MRNLELKHINSAPFWWEFCEKYGIMLGTIEKFLYSFFINIVFLFQYKRVENFEFSLEIKEKE